MEGQRVVPNQNIYWARGGYLNQKRPIQMSEEEKYNVARCSGEKSEHLCKNPIFKCKECANYGCAQEVSNKCTAQGFKNNICLNCGVAGSRIPVMKKELAKFIAEWEKNDL
ncbi:MAG: hypothetical protein FNP40_02710 [Dehalobacter sp. 4CP]|uniref:hypothetical protein n=1 Tax=Dehalobacter sp. CP TaxID=2594474 RepID=UPI0013C7CEDB|nr:hypothetical protein [Dehalobacter sp.]NBJ14485.1 hypothetical protein [Dehalobacter sp. 4CP]